MLLGDGVQRRFWSRTGGQLARSRGENGAVALRMVRMATGSLEQRCSGLAAV